ncbi:iron ABC transporter permease [Fluviicola sp. SGL-29]|nr:iron ABC transporter permease [Fluviicola sp. SGL-29]
MRGKAIPFRLKIFIGTLLLIGLAIWHLFAGSTTISVSDFYNALADYDYSNTNHIIARDLRIPRTLMAMIAGAGLSLAGLLMQTIFKNPLAEPNILGVSTGASLFVAITLLTGISFFQSDWGLIASALFGAFIFGTIILFFARFVRSQGSLLLVGIMLGSFSAAFISIIQAWSDAHQLKLYTLWAMGSLQQVSFQQLPLVCLMFSGTVFLSFFFVRALNALILGQENASLLGINVRNVRVFAILIAAVLTGLITAFCGPIAFLGMAVPNLVKMILKTHNHRLLIIGCLLTGGSFLLMCDILVQLLSGFMLLPINAITSMIGAPFVIYIILKRWS